MIKTFFSPHIDDIMEFTDQNTFKYDFKKGQRNWQYFENLNISKDKEFVEKYFGQYPVLYVDLKDVGGENESMMLGSLKQIISNVFQNNLYVLKRLQNMNKKQGDDNIKFWIREFEDYCYRKKDDLTDSLRFLSELLYEYFNKKVIVLIDEYDRTMMKMMNDGLQGKENQQLRKWTSYQISSMLGSLIEGNDKVEKALLIGILDTLQKDLIRTTVLNLANNQEKHLQLMIGLTQEEIETFIIQQMIAPDDNNRESKAKNLFKNIKLWYKGYDLRWGQSSVSLYTPLSVGSYLQDVIRSKNQALVPRSYWNQTGCSEILINLTRLKTSKDFQLTLLNYILGKGKLYRKCHLNVPDLLVSADPQTEEYDDLALEILQQGGYLKISKHKSFFKYSNLETEIYFKHNLVYIICCRSFGFDTGLTLFKFYRNRFVTFEKEAFCSFVQEYILNELPKSQQNVENEFYLQAFFTCLSINCFLEGGKVTVKAAPQYKTKFNKRIDNVFFPIQGYGRKLVIHEYKCTFSEANAQSLLKKAIWQIYAKCYMSGFTSSKDWDFIVVRAFVLYQDKEYNWHLIIKEYQHLNEVAQILMENCFLKDKQLLKNCEDLAEGTNNSRQQFLKQYGCKDFNDFIKYFNYLQQDLQVPNQQQQEDENYQVQFDQMKIQEEKQNLFDRIGKLQLQKIEELLKRKEEYLKNKIQVEHQCLSKPEKSANRPISVKQKVEDDRTKIRRSEHEDAFREKRKIRKQEEQVEEGIQEEILEGIRKEKEEEQERNLEQDK